MKRKASISATVSYPSVWGTTTTTEHQTYPGDIGEALKVHMVNVHEATGVTKSYGYITNINAMTNKVEFDSTTNFITLKIYTPQNMVNSVRWLRSCYAGHTNAIDFQIKILFQIMQDDMNSQKR